MELHAFMQCIVTQGEQLKHYVHSCYTIEIYKRIYALFMMGISRQHMWSETLIIPPLPPNFGKGKGRSIYERD